MQSDFYRSPIPAEPHNDPEPEFPKRPAKSSMPKPRFSVHGVAPLAVFSAGILVLLICLLGLRLSGMDLYPWTWVADESSHDAEEEERDYSKYFSENRDVEEETSEITIPQGPLDENFRLELKETGAEMTAGEIYNKVLPSVVYIESGDDSYLYSASGIILTEDGYVLTNCHVISGCSSAWTTLYTGERYESTLVGYDEKSDLAVLKIPATDLPAAEFGDSDQIQVGDSVLAIGNPLGSGLYGTMTDGIVSAIDRALSVNGFTMDLIQTSAALNSGNSGGALVNSSGQVIGITNVKLTSSIETLEGLGFAIPSSVAKEVTEALVTRGSMTRPTIGITCYALSEDEAELLGINGGIFVNSVTTDGPAQKAGVIAGDIIIEANGQSMTTLDDLTEARNSAGVGGKLVITVLRGDQTLTLTLLVAEESA